MEVCNEARARIHEFCSTADKEDSMSKINDDKDQYHKVYTCIIQLDHMRDKRKYIKIIERWSNDLHINGTIIFYGKTKIFLVLIGEEKNLNRFQQLLKTNNVDIDSRGRPCKEKLSKVLCCELLQQSPRGDRTVIGEADGTEKHKTLRVLEAEDKVSLKQCFCDMKLEYLYSKYI